ncbi:protein FAM221A [Ascaphus truei]|uniref:protein FAM221A n=1 Tax=Ascaphus truei TaxID=8439 RepID=UPI003F598BFD
MHGRSRPHAHSPLPFFRTSSPSCFPAHHSFSGGIMERLRLQGPGAAASIDEYLEYRRIVGEDDGGNLFTPEEYEKYKKKVLPMRLQNRLYVSWRSPSGMDCKLVGPETPCFCTHRYKQHQTDFKEIPKDRPVTLPCNVRQCQCKSFHYVPLNGSQPIRCRCKHFADEHSVAGSYHCTKCSKCAGFHSCFTCGCTQPAYAHETVVETKEERLAQGKPVGHDVPYAAMGGLTGFSSLAEGYMRLDESGIGAPDQSFFESSTSGTSHPFLRAYSPAIASRAVDGPSSTETQMSNLTVSEKDDMDFFEKRYQERLREEKEQKRQKNYKPVSSPRP